MADSKLRILSINAHPHDFTHYAGALGVHVARGDSVTVVSVTSGSKTHNEKLADELRKPPEQRDPKIMNQTEDDYAKIKAKELRDACALFGITDVRILGYPEPFRLTLYEDSIEIMKNLFLEIRPHILITQSPYLVDYHTGMPNAMRDDHTEVASASLEARNRATVATYGSKVAPHKTAVTYFPGVYFHRDQYDFLVDVSEYFEKRVQAEAMYVTQGHTPEGSRQRITMAIGPIGFLAGVPYAEAFVREKVELLGRLPVPESALRDSQSSYSEIQKRRVGKG
ncbi:MAG: hypothetical protein FJ319_03415 [SAR202 cluster bacterium]|nr:hypothetical protein [SAR202 cluster bacterium]